MKQLIPNLKDGDYIMTRFKANKKEIFYVSQITVIEEKCCEVSFLRKSEKVKNKFIFPNVKDVSEVDKADIAFKLPDPRVTGTKNTTRFTAFRYQF